MRLHYGPVPENPDFRPQEEGWTPLREPSVTAFTWLASGIGLAVGIAVATLWAVTVPGTSIIRISTSASDASAMSPWMALAMILGAVAGLIIIHELLHAATYPGRLFGERTVIGVWPRKGLFYAHYDGSLSRNRCLLVFLVPFLVLTIGLWLVELIFRTGWGLMPGWSILNAMFAGGDILATAMMAGQIPKEAEVRNQGWNTWWRLPERDASHADIAGA
jgi:hypothetical protein